MFPLSELTQCQGASSNANECSDSFGTRLRAKLGQQPSPLSGSHGEHETQNHVEDDVHVSKLFSTAAKAFDLELKSNTQISNNIIKNAINNNNNRNVVNVNAHWIPGRIEVMGKHTDYAGGNSLVCATSGRGMAMVSTLLMNQPDSNVCANGNKRGESRRLKITIVSVLPKGMEHHYTEQSAAPYEVDGRPVVHYTICVPNNRNQTCFTTNSNASEKDEAEGGEGGVDWTIYPATVINRLHQNFGLFPHCTAETTATTENKPLEINSGQTTFGGGGHIVIAISSNLPPASGLSTSSAFVTGLFLVLDKLLGISSCDAYQTAIGQTHDENTICNLSTYLGNVENGRDYINNKNGTVLKGTVQGGVGTFGGSEDHAAILLGKGGELRLLSFCPTRPYCSSNPYNSSADGAHDNENNNESIVHLSKDITFVIAYSGAQAEKAGGIDGDTEASTGYNNASELARKAFEAYYFSCTTSDERNGLKTNPTLAGAVRNEYNRLDTNDPFVIKKMMSRAIKSLGRSMALSIRAPPDICAEDYATSLVQRFEQFYDESELLVPRAARAISKGEYGNTNGDLLGQLVDASHRGAVNLLKNQIAETAWLPLWARGIEDDLQIKPSLLVRGPSKELDPSEKIQTSAESDKNDKQSKRVKALAASAFGAGFGGSCWALVYRHEAQQFAEQWQDAYDDRFPVIDGSGSDSGAGLTREFFLVDPGPGAFCV